MDEFETIVEDGSSESVSKDTTNLLKGIYLGDLTGLQRLEQQANAVSNKPILARASPLRWLDTDSGEGEGD